MTLTKVQREALHRLPDDRGQSDSQDWDLFPEDPVSKLRVESPIGDNVHLPVQPVHQVQSKSGKVQKRSPGLQFNEEVHVTPWHLLAPRNRAEDPRLNDPMREENVRHLLPPPPMQAGSRAAPCRTGPRSGLAVGNPAAIATNPGRAVVALVKVNWR